jgi:hypothetical protein
MAERIVQLAGARIGAGATADPHVEPAR